MVAFVNIFDIVIFLVFLFEPIFGYLQGVFNLVPNGVNWLYSQYRCNDVFFFASQSFDYFVVFDLVCHSLQIHVVHPFVLHPVIK